MLAFRRQVCFTACINKQVHDLDKGTGISVRNVTDICRAGEPADGAISHYTLCLHLSDEVYRPKLLQNRLHELIRVVLDFPKVLLPRITKLCYNLINMWFFIPLGINGPHFKPEIISRFILSFRADEC